jgi:hypothetical protein
MAVAPTDYVLKAYMSEADARADTNALYVTSSTDGTLSNATCQSGTTTDDAGNTTYFHFYIFEKYWFRIESNELSTAFEIDWDDGEDNSAEKSNTTLLTYENPRFIGVTPKIFTKHGAHYPLLRAKNVEGFWSKWYTPYSTSNDLTTVNDDMKYFRAQYDSGLNTAYTVSMETINKPHIPILVPANKPPTAILKTDRKQIFSGIDNISLLEAVGTLKVTCDNTVRDDVVVRVIYENNTSSIQEALLSISGDGGDIATDANTDLTITNARKVLRLELLDSRETTSATVTNKLASGERIYLYNDTATNSSQNRHDDVMAFVSAGNPVVSLNEPGHYVTVDGSESATRAQNVSIKQYYFDTDKLQYSGQGNSTAHTQDSDTTSYFTDFFESDEYQGPFLEPTLKVSYSLDHKFDLVDAHGRFLPQTRLIRLQVEDTGDDTDIDTVADKIRRSEVECFRRHDYYDGDTDNDDTINVTTANNYIQRRPSSLTNFSAFLTTRSATGAHETSPNWSDRQDHNFKIGDTYNIVNGEDGHLQEMSDASGTLFTPPQNFWFIAKDEIFDRLHFRTSFEDMSAMNPPTFDHYNNPTSPNFASIELQVYYPAFRNADRKNIVWKPLRYVDGTAYDNKRGNSLSRSGVVSWDIPEDWLKTKHYYNATPTLSNPTVDYDMGGTAFDEGLGGYVVSGVDVVWDVDSYALLIGYACDRSGITDANSEKFRIHKCIPFSNSHSQAVEVIDPTHISLNEFAMAQSISFTRKGKFQKIENRLGTAEIRKIGVSGGAIKFGSLDLKGDPNAMRKKMYEYQRDAVPVFLDVTHRNDEFTRFFGVITDMSEDHPTGGVIPKFALSMQVTKIGMFDSSGALISNGLVALGGEIDDKPDFIGFGGQKT